MNEIINPNLKNVVKITEEHLRKVFKKKPIKKILFINPPDVDESIFDFDVAKRGRSNNYPAYGIGVLASKLLDKGYIPKICNLNHQILKLVQSIKKASDFDFIESWQKEVDQRIYDFMPDIIGVTCTFSVTHPSFKKVCDYIKSKNPDLPIVVGGVHVTHDLEEILNSVKSADFAITNEAENALDQFLDVVNGKDSSNSLSQLAFIFKKKFYNINNLSLPTDAELDLIPLYEEMDIQSHSEVGTIGSFFSLIKPESRIATIQSNRGCRAACTFCNVRTFHGKGVRQRSVDSVIEELKMLKQSYGIDHVVWLDDDLLKNERRAAHLFNEMIKNNLNMTWDATNGVIAKSLHNVEVVDAAEKSGCVGVNIGIESGNPKILRDIRKPGTVDTFLKAAEVLSKFPKINTRSLLIIGFPNETFRMMFDTIKLSEEMNLDWNNISVLQPWKNTPIYDQMTEEGLLGDQEGTLKTEKNEVSPYQLGIYSRQRAIEKGLIEQSVFGEKQGLLSGFLNRIEISDLDDVPDNKFLDDIWFYMNIRLNFARLMRETRISKVNQQFKFLEYVSTKTAPDNALIVYFYGYLEKKLHGSVSPELKKRLQTILISSEYWRVRFEHFKLNYSQFLNEEFPERILTGGIPLDFRGQEKHLFEFPKNKIA